MDTNDRILLQRSVNQNDRIIAQNERIIQQNAQIVDALSRIGDRSNAIASRSLDVFETIGKVTAQLATFESRVTSAQTNKSVGNEDNGTIASLRAEISRLKESHASVRRKVNSVSNEWEETSKTELNAYRKQKEKLRQWIYAVLLVLITIGVYTAIRQIAATQTVPGLPSK